jgi:hypothetical protein
VKPVFLDAVGLAALWNRSDQWYAAALKAFDALEKANRSYISTPFVLAECGNAASRRPFRQNVVTLRHSLEASNSLIWPTEQDWSDAWTAYERGAPANPTLSIVSHSSSCAASA